MESESAESEFEVYVPEKEYREDFANPQKFDDVTKDLSNSMLDLNLIFFLKWTKLMKIKLKEKLLIFSAQQKLEKCFLIKQVRK